MAAILKQTRTYGKNGKHYYLLVEDTDRSGWSIREDLGAHGISDVICTGWNKQMMLEFMESIDGGR